MVGTIPACIFATASSWLHSLHKNWAVLSDIHNVSRLVGLNMHLGKTKVMLNNQTNKATTTVNATI